jgi:hypothetical protein
MTSSRHASVVDWTLENHPVQADPRKKCDRATDVWAEPNYRAGWLVTARVVQHSAHLSGSR